MCLCAAPGASAAPGWYDGNAQYTYALNCPSVIFGNPYIEASGAAYSSVYLDLNNLPDAGEVFYIRVTTAQLGNPCSGGSRANVEMQLPPSVRYSISPEFPVYCFTQRDGPWQREAASCPQSPGGGGRFGQTFNPRNSQDAAWPMAQGRFWQFQIPVYSTKRLTGAGAPGPCGDCFRAPVQLIDGNSNDYVQPFQYLNVDFAAPGAGFPTPFFTFPANNKVQTEAYEFNYFEPGPVYALLTEDQNLNGQAEVGETSAAVTAQATANDYAIEMKHIWSNLKPNTRYLYELAIEPARTPGVFLVSEPMGFTTPPWPGPPAGVLNDESGSGTGVPTLPPRSETPPPPTQPDAPADPFSALDAGRLGAGAGARRVIAKISPAKKVRRRGALKKRAVIVPFRCAAACTLKATLHLGKQKRKIASGRASLKKAGKGKLKLKLTKKGRALVKKARKGGALQLRTQTRVTGFPVFNSKQLFKLVR